VNSNGIAAGTSDPSWFFSSLAQSTASIVGFVGALLIFECRETSETMSRDIGDGWNRCHERFGRL
jgi:hypothetical protein